MTLLDNIDIAADNQHLTLTCSGEVGYLGAAYKVLRSNVSSYFVPCAKSKYNGRLRFTYFTRDYVSLPLYFADCSSESRKRLLIGLLSTLIEIQENGFVSVRNIVVEPSLIFIEPFHEMVKLIGVPLVRPASSELEDCQSVYRLCVDFSSRFNIAPAEFAVVLESPGYKSGNLKALRRELCGNAGESDYSDESREWWRERACSSGSLCLRSRYKGKSSSIAIPHGRSILGKSANKADIVFSESRRVSRAHCVLDLTPDGLLRVEDVGSTNGTYLNGRKVVPGKSVSASLGDTLRVADVEFTIAREG